MAVTATPTALDGVWRVEPRVFRDERGFFTESFNARDFAAAVGGEVRFVQDSHAGSERGVLRGLHLQVDPMAQGKLVRVTVGEVFDVAVDLRPGSPTFGRWVGETLSAANGRQLWIPAGFAHGYLVLSDRAEFQYKVTAYYSPAHERVLAWDDPAVAVDWPLGGARPTLSPKDAAGAALAAFR